MTKLLVNLMLFNVLCDCKGAFIFTLETTFLAVDLFVSPNVLLYEREYMS